MPVCVATRKVRAGICNKTHRAEPADAGRATLLCRGLKGTFGVVVKNRVLSKYLELLMGRTLAWEEPSSLSRSHTGRTFKRKLMHDNDSEEDAEKNADYGEGDKPWDEIVGTKSKVQYTDFSQCGDKGVNTK